MTSPVSPVQKATHAAINLKRCWKSPRLIAMSPAIEISAAGVGYRASILAMLKQQTVFIEQQPLPRITSKTSASH
jgi:hypothetical protein